MRKFIDLTYDYNPIISTIKNLYPFGCRFFIFLNGTERARLQALLELGSPSEWRRCKLACDRRTKCYEQRSCEVILSSDLGMVFFVLCGRDADSTYLATCREWGSPSEWRRIGVPRSDLWAFGGSRWKLACDRRAKCYKQRGTRSHPIIQPWYGVFLSKSEISD